MSYDDAAAYDFYADPANHVAAGPPRRLPQSALHAAEIRRRVAATFQAVAIGDGPPSRAELDCRDLLEEVDRLNGVIERLQVEKHDLAERLIQMGGDPS